MIPVDKVVSGEKIAGWYDLKDPTTTKRGKPIKAQVYGTLRCVDCNVCSIHEYATVRWEAIHPHLGVMGLYAGSTLMLVQQEPTLTPSYFACIGLCLLTASITKPTSTAKQPCTLCIRSLLFLVWGVFEHQHM